MPTKDRSRSRTIFIHILLFIACFAALLYVRFHVNNSITGDEPHYLLMNYSLVHDHDLNLKNNYENGDSRDFYPGLAATQQVGVGQGTSESQRWYSIHGIGLPILMLPGFMLDGGRGAIVMMVLFAAITVWLLMAWTYQVTKKKRLSYLVAFGLFAMYSFNGLAGYLYPDIIIAGLTLAGLLIIERYYRQPIFQALLGFIAGFIILIHLKGIAVSGPLLIALTFKLWQEKKRLPWPAIAVFVPVMAYFFLSNYGWFGIWNPTKIYGELIFPQIGPETIIPAFLFDSMRGFLIYNPIILLVFVGVPIWFVKKRNSLLLSLFVMLPSVVALAVFKGWQGGDSQIGRYAIDFIPVIMPAIAFAIEAMRQRWQQIIIVLLFAATLFISIDSVKLKRSYVRYDTRSPIFVQIEEHTGLAIDRILPTYDSQSKPINDHTLTKNIAGFSLLAILTIYGVYLSQPSRRLSAPK